MIRLKRLTALLLCLLMILPTQGLTILADTLPIENGAAEEETLLQETEGKDTEEETKDEERVDVTLPLETLETEDYIIYWNPGGRLPDGLATASDATASDATPSNATSSDAVRGKDSADGLSATTPVKTLAKALERAEEMMDREGVSSFDITIYAMNPMEIPDGELYILNAGNLNIVSWPGRPYDSDVLFYVNGGQLTLMNVNMRSGESGSEPEETDLVYISGGILQMAQNVLIDGRTVLDYRSEIETVEWSETATPSEAVKRVAGDAAFHINDYILATDEDLIDLLTDSVEDSTWREPMIELVEGFSGSDDGYLLEVLDDGDAEEQQLVTTLYADDATAEEFLGYFTLTEANDWKLQVETEAGIVADQFGAIDGIVALALSLEEETLTRKTLIASRAYGDKDVIYWNPGKGMTIDNVFYPEGDDTLYDGSGPHAPLKTWSLAASEAKKVGGVVVAMQSLNLGTANAGDYLDQLPGGEFYLKSTDADLITPLGTWKPTAQPAIVVPKGETLIAEDIYFGGRYDDNGNETEAQTILINQGDLIIDKNVRTEEFGYIQLNAFYELEDHPIQLHSIDGTYDGDLRIFFGDINKNIAYRYTDVAVPGGDLALSITNDADPDARANQVGEALLSRIKMHKNNRTQANGGLSSIDWSLRQDTGEDDSIVVSQNIELYAMYYFDGIYIDGVNGDNRNYGASCDYPVKTWERARKIWQDEIDKSLKARREATGMTLAEIEAAFPMPEVIYICDTVTIDTATEPEWVLETKYDQARNENVLTEVVSHIDNIAGEGEGASKVSRHEVPKNLIKVTGSGVLSVRDVFIRNMVDDTDSITILVEAGGTLNLRGETTLNGTRLKSSGFAEKQLTLGNHITVNGAGSLVMETNWTGAIEYREQGIVAAGSGATVEMNNGFIRQNNSYRADYYSAGIITHKAGGGVALSGGARFTMNGGEINGNQTYQYGAGVYLTGAGTSFTMNKGKISENNISTLYVSNNNSSYLYAKGAGIYADTGTSLTIGDGTGAPEDTLISANKAILAYGTGVYTNGSLMIDNAVISDNVGGGSSSLYYVSNCGVGIYVGANGVLNMKNGLISGNHGAFTYYGYAKGAGIYFEAGKSTHTITDSVITGNESGYEYSSGSNVTSYSQGGGIYISEGNTLSITDTTISKNRSGRGGGIYSIGSYSTPVELTLTRTMIEENKAEGYQYKTYGDAGGVFFSGYGNLRMEDGTKLTGNSAAQYAGGLYISGSSTAGLHVYMMGTQPGAIEISGNYFSNTGSIGYGAGIYHNVGTLHAENALISNNKDASTGGGIYAPSSSAYAYMRNVTISGNEAGNGAGLALSGSRYYMQDCEITGNTATGMGGGFYLYSTSTLLYLSESEEKKFLLKDNHADYGGGIAITYASTFMMDIAGPIQNSADQQGSNFYLSGYASIDIFNGEFRQPELADQKDGVYNIYINDTSTSNYIKYFDFSKVTAEKKAGAKPDVIYLNSGSSYLSVLAVPPDDTTLGAFPIDVNKDVFRSGSVVLKPHGYTYAINRSMQEPNTTLSASTTVNKKYESLMTAMTNVDHYREGQLPRRNELGGFKDANNTNKINVILVGEGVYLAGYKADGTGGDDNNGGTSPDDAVATFDVAKDILKDRIENAAARDLLLPEDEREGYSPFIYICGQVEINADEHWELDYADTLFTDVNENYEKAEIRNDDKVYEPQVRRFASYLNQPMIKVGTGSNTVKFSTGRLIIDGMADSVVLSDQSDKSPVIRGLAGTHITLNGDSMIRNNYYVGLDIYGELTLQGEEGKVNKQLYNNQAYQNVRLYGSTKMSMLKGARIITDNTAEKVASFTGNGIQFYGTNSSLLIDDDSAIIQETGSSLLNGYLIYSTYANTTVEMKKDSKLVSGNSVSTGIYVDGNDSVINMTQDASIEALSDAVLTTGIYVGKNTSLTMSNQTKITHGGGFSGTTYGVNVDSASVTASVKMENEASIVVADTFTNSSSYWYYGIFVSRGVSPKIELLNNAKIQNNSMKSSYIAGIGVNSSNCQDLQVLLNMEAALTDEEKNQSVVIGNFQHGMYLSGAKNPSVSMGKNAVITGGTYGMYIGNISDNTSATSVLMKDNSRINKATYGIHFYGYNRGPINIEMRDNAAIESNSEGISESTTTNGYNYGVWKLNLEMFDKARISGNSGPGIKMVHTSGTWDSTCYHKVTLNGEAVIGGDSYYSSTDAASGNQGAGIYANSPIQVTLNDQSRISGNGTNINSNYSSAGIYLTRSTSTSYHRAGTAKIILNHTASICNNRGGGVYAQTIGNSTTTYHNEVLIELNGIKDDGSLSTPSIKDNTDAIYLGTDATLNLKGEAFVKISDTPYSTSSYVARAIDVYGDIKLDGRSSVNGLIYMNNSDRPITMTYPGSGTSPKYDLHLVEGFTGKTVVQPDMIGITDLTGASSQRVYFNKASAGGMAASRPIVEMSPNLVLLGENNVFLSGTGNDDFTGNTPSTAVKTFDRARELLQGDGYYTTGANVIICTSTVNVLAKDTDWSFETGGYVTNSLSGHRWQPTVIRHEEYKGVLITISSGTSYASSVTFENITIDGGSQNGITLTSAGNDQLLNITQGCTAVLGAGSILQNNKAVTTTYSDNTTLGVRVYGGTLEIDGGTIQNIVRQTSGSFSNWYFSSAILVQGTSVSYPAKLIMKSGQIINNELNAPNAYSTGARLGTIYVTGVNSYVEMRGGLIENNKVVTRESNPAAAGAIVNNNGSVTINGGIIRENKGGRGSAIYHESAQVGSRLIFAGGQISKNTTTVSGQQSIDQYSPIYVVQNGFELDGGGADLSDGIYLYHTAGTIKVTDHIQQTGRSYRIYLRQGSSSGLYQKGSVVVEPDGNKVTDVIGYLPYFDVRTNPYVLDRGRTDKIVNSTNGVREEQCLILMKAIYLDYEKGKDGNSGLKPSQAVQTFTKAKSIGALTSNGSSEHYVIYVSGKAKNTAGESVWTLPITAYMCRYTGFAVYESNGVETAETERAYYGVLIEPAYDLTLKDISVVGRRSTDINVENNGDSLVKVLPGIHVAVENGAAFADNYNMGNYIAEDGKPDNLDSNGGAFQVAEGGVLTISGGEIKGNRATRGNAIYLHASETNPASLGELYLTGSPVISGNVYLNGTADTTAAFVQPDAGFIPATALLISVSNDFNGRPLIKYTDGTIPGEDERDYFTFDDAIRALYDIVNNSLNASILELGLRRVIYLDGQSGSDDISHDGSTPQKAFKTLKRTFQAIGNNTGTNGVLVYIVDTVEVSDTSTEPSLVELMNIKVFNSDGTTHYEGYYKGGGDTVDIRGQVYFKRYSQPKGYDPADPTYEGFDNETLYETLFYVGNNGTLTLSGIYMDGHSVNSDSIDPTLVAPAVVAQSPLVTVEGSGKLQCYRAEGVSNGVPTATLFINNHNAHNKNAPEYIVGRLNDSDIMEGSSAGIELIAGGTSVLEYTEFSNLSLGDNVVSGGTDVYSNGFLHFSRYTNFGGSIFLEGLGTKDANHDTSRYLTVDVYGTPVLDNFNVLMRDPYMGRDVVHYQTGITATAKDAAYFLLEERVKDYFCLANRSGKPHILELQVPVAVYIDGLAGVDNPDDRVAGSTPRSPVKSLYRAFELLKTRGGNTIYVVGTVQIGSDVQMTGMSYVGTDGTVALGSTNKVNIIRYMQPDFAIDDPGAGVLAGYDVPDYTGVLLNVKDGATARFSSNVIFDGHSEPKTSIDLPIGAIVDRNGEAKAPLITVERGGTLNLLSGVTLLDNNNTYDPDTDSIGQHGGAISNSGTTLSDNTLYENNKAARGSVTYQDGTFTIVSAPEKMKDHENTFYLTTVNTGTPANPIWGADNVIQTAVAIPEKQIFEIDMDHAVKGRDVVRFTNSSAYDPNADAEHVHFELGSTVPDDLFLVEAEGDPDVLELQNWEILKVAVPTDIYLVVQRRGTIESTTKLMGVIGDSSSGIDLFTTPEYTVSNNGIYDVKVSISGFENKTTAAGITADLMNLTVSAATATTEKDLYLAVKGLDDTTAGNGFGFTETSLQPYAEPTVTAAPIVLGTLKTKTSGNFTFVGAAGSGFVDKYMDASFPIEGATKEEVQQYMDGTSGGGPNAAAKYLMKYKVEIDPSRRTP